MRLEGVFGTKKTELYYQIWGSSAQFFSSLTSQTRSSHFIKI
jgi:hypothetical protein